MNCFLPVSMNIFLLMILKLSFNEIYGCDQVEIGGASRQDDKNGPYDLLMGASCHGRPVFVRRLSSHKAYYLYYLEEQGPNLWSGWLVGPAICQHYGYIASSDPTAHSPSEAHHIWEEVNKGAWHPNPQIVVECTDRFLKRGVTSMIMLGAIIILSFVGTCYVVKIFHKQSWRQPRGSLPRTCPRRRFPHGPPIPLHAFVPTISHIPSNLPKYEDVGQSRRPQLSPPRCDPPSYEELMKHAEKPGASMDLVGYERKHYKKYSKDEKKEASVSRTGLVHYPAVATNSSGTSLEIGFVNQAFGNYYDVAETRL